MHVATSSSHTVCPACAVAAVQLLPNDCLYAILLIASCCWSSWLDDKRLTSIAKRVPHPIGSPIQVTLKLFSNPYWQSNMLPNPFV